MSAAAVPPRAAGVVLGVDLGTRRVGLALSDRSRTLASPWRVLQRSGRSGADLDALAAAVEEAGASAVVVGLPLSLDGHLGPAARRALTEVAGLRRRLEGGGVAVDTVDERFTTASAQVSLAAAGHSSRSQRQRVDAAAAAVLLQSWLDARPSPPGGD